MDRETFVARVAQDKKSLDGLSRGISHGCCRGKSKFLKTSDSQLFFGNFLVTNDTKSVTIVAVLLKNERYH